MNQATTKALVRAAARRHAPEFEAIHDRFEDRGILNSEMLAVCGVSEELGVEVLIESGRWRGHSTEVLAKYFAGKPVALESIEAFHDDNAKYVEEKMRPYANLNLHYGDANWVVPRLVRKHRHRKIAILFDGPKGRVALDIFRLCLSCSDNVLVGFFHDMRQPTAEMPNGSRGEMASDFPDAFYTDDSDYVEDFRVFDDGCHDFHWRPHTIHGKPIGSYGPTLGVSIPTERDKKNAQAERVRLQRMAVQRTAYFVGLRGYQTARKLVRLSVSKLQRSLP